MYVGYNKNAVKWKYDIAQNPFSNINVHPLYHPMGSWKIPTIILSEYHCSRVLFAFFLLFYFSIPLFNSVQHGFEKLIA